MPGCVECALEPPVTSEAAAVEAVVIAVVVVVVAVGCLTDVCGIVVILLVEFGVDVVELELEFVLWFAMTTEHASAVASRTMRRSVTVVIVIVSTTYLCCCCCCCR